MIVALRTLNPRAQEQLCRRLHRVQCVTGRAVVVASWRRDRAAGRCQDFLCELIVRLVAGDGCLNPLAVLEDAVEADLLAGNSQQARM